MNQNLSILFFPKRTKKDFNLVTIYCRITLDGIREEISTGCQCPKNEWDRPTKRIIGTTKHTQSCNKILEDLESKIQQVYKKCLRLKKNLLPHEFKDEVLGRKRSKPTLISVFKEHNLRMETLLETEYVKGTLSRYQTTLSHIQAFLLKNYKSKDISLNRIGYGFLSDFDYFLRTEKKCNKNTTNKYLKNLGKIVRICLGNGWMQIDPFINYKLSNKAVHRTALTLEEMKLLIGKSFDSKTLSLVRDVFIFCCYTGLSYIDLKNLKTENLITGVDGRRWISIVRSKTGVVSKIPILPIALDILMAYESKQMDSIYQYAFPVISNQKMNIYLKEIAGICNIHKSLTFHISRHTFATTVTLNNGVPIETVCKMLGHSTVKTTEIYAKVLDSKISEDMEQLFHKPI
ncbi:site-specific integrase [Pedobacter aquatilis]|uniref:site-specific integrase n=1 Tax=Pedobacter aquatilis TaxID=351343 RepID=UPI00292CAA15|nr:site-specific integrase [Pedobacter aquatilis]